MQQPAVAAVDGDAGMATGVPDQRHQRQLDIEPRQDPHALESEPLVAAVGVMGHPLRTVLPVDARIAKTLVDAWVKRGRKLGCKDVDLGRGEVGEAPGVVGVEVGGDDVANVAGREAEPLELLQRRRLDLRPSAHKALDAESPRILRVLDPEAGVDEDQPFAGLDRQAVADDQATVQQAAVAVDQAPAVRAERPAIEVVDPHSAAESFTLSASARRDDP